MVVVYVRIFFFNISYIFMYKIIFRNMYNICREWVIKKKNIFVRRFVYSNIEIEKRY